MGNVTNSRDQARGRVFGTKAHFAVSLPSAESIPVDEATGSHAPRTAPSFDSSLTRMRQTLFHPPAPPAAEWLTSGRGDLFV
jgi:hypothetical protein